MITKALREHALRVTTRYAFVPTLFTACIACTPPEPPPTDDPPEPQATQLRDAMQAPIEKAKGVEGTVQDAADRQRAEIDAAGG